MALLPEGFALPPLAYLAVLAIGTIGAVGAVYAVSPPITERTTLAFAPWMVLGSALYVLYQIDALPAVVAPFFGSPVVYATTLVPLGALWAASSRFADSDDGPPPGDITTVASERTTENSATANGPTAGDRSRTTAIVLGGVGLALALAVVAGALWVGVRRGSLLLFWPTVGLLASFVLAGATWAIVRRGQVGTTGWVGPLVIFAHALDGVSTAVGVDVLGFGEQTPLARVFLEVGASSPVADVLGPAWLFVAVKIVLAVVVVWLLADSVRERPQEGYLLCAFVAAVGLGPGAHNLLLFAVAG